MEAAQVMRLISEGQFLPRSFIGYEAGCAITEALQRLILGLEAYVPAAVMREAVARGKPVGEMYRLTRNPFRVGGSGTADVYFNRLPTLVEPNLMMRNECPELWVLTRDFYREVRNPIFHGWQLSGEPIEGVREAFKLIGNIYLWVDTWHSLQHDIRCGNRGRLTPSPRTELKRIN